MASRIHLYCFSVVSLLLVGSCTHIRYESEGFIPLYYGPRENHHHEVVVEGIKEFYLWGRIHPDDYVYLDKELYNQDFLSVGDIQITQFQTINQFFSAFFSLGFYIPISYRITGKGVKDDD